MEALGFRSALASSICERHGGRRAQCGRGAGRARKPALNGAFSAAGVGLGDAPLLLYRTQKGGRGPPAIVVRTPVCRRLCGRQAGVISFHTGKHCRWGGAPLRRHSFACRSTTGRAARRRRRRPRGAHMRCGAGLRGAAPESRDACLYTAPGRSRNIVVTFKFFARAGPPGGRRCAFLSTYRPGSLGPCQGRPCQKCGARVR
ncbi:MAG: hypothetical protein J3K34DRAFT_125121 [Monoraphidium minutum]|nr:MAG: hypothetical protein J3K34DRAFT_125121 [Monoraphidium minutum]